MIKTVHIAVYCRETALKAGALLTLKTIRVGFPTASVYVHWAGDDETVERQCKAACVKAQAEFVRSGETQAQLMRRMTSTSDECFAFVDSDVVFFEQCEGFESCGMLAGEFIPQFVCPIARAITVARLHSAFLIVRDPVALREELHRVYQPMMARHCPFDPFTGVVTWHDGRPWFRDVAANLYHAVGGESFGPDMLRRFEHLYAGSYSDLVSPEHRAQLEAAYANPETARGFRKVMDKFFSDRSL